MKTFTDFRFALRFFALYSALLAVNAVVVQTLHDLSARGECKRDIETVISFTEKLFTGNDKLTYAISGTAAYSTCNIVNHYAGTQHPCQDFTVLMGALVFSALAASVNSNWWEGTASGPGSRRRQLAMSGLDELLADMFADQGFVWDALESTTPAFIHFVDSNDLDSDFDGGAIAEQYVFRGVTHPNMSLPAANICLTSFVNGTGFVRSRQVAPSTVGGSGVQRRHEGPGFKVNWKIFDWSLSFGAPSAREAIQPVLVRLGQDISQHWAYSANYFMLDEWIGVVGVNYILLRILAVGIRIIPSFVALERNMRM